MDQRQFVLKGTPPRAPRTSLPRQRLADIWADIHDRPVVAVQAPRGFGKTTLLVQWRRLWLEQGALVAWVTLDAEDNPDRFAVALLHAMRMATGRPAFDTIAAQCAGRPDRQLDALTGLLAEIAVLAAPTVLMLDDAERLPDVTAHEALAYLLQNAPPNLHIVIGTRKPLPIPTSELTAHGMLAALAANDLRFALDESVAVLRKHFGERLSLDDCARLHEITEGWPIALQLAAASIERRPDLNAAVASLSARQGDIERYFLESLFAQLPQPLTDFLTRVAILDTMVPDLCDAVTGGSSATAMLEQLGQDTPIVIVAEGRDWMRLHPLARDFLLGRFERLPTAERHELHSRAARWLADRQFFHEAALHAFATGDRALAQTYAERCLWALVNMGKLGEAREWLDRFPEDAIARDVRLQLVAAWTMALGDRPAQATELAGDIARDPSASQVVQYEAAQVLACAASFTDRVGAIPGILAPWEGFPAPATNPTLAIANTNVLALVALMQGATDRARMLETNVSVRSGDASLLLALGFGCLVVGLSHLWDGNAIKAEAALRPALDIAERDAGRRSLVASMFASALAAAMYERNQTAAAAAVLANRLDVIERTGLPDVILLAYRTLASLGLAEANERRALDVLDNLRLLGESRGVPRLILHSIAEQVRIHALRAHHETVDSLLVTLDGLAPNFAHRDYAIYEPQYRMHVAVAKAHAALARHDLDATDRNLKLADALAASLHRGRDALVVKVLRAVAADQRGSTSALPLLGEARSLAALGGLERLLIDTHPLAQQMMTRAERGARPIPATTIQPAAQWNAPNRQPAATDARRVVVPIGGLLTPKEAEVLGLLNSGMSNKLIAKTMDISDETVKWHLKNLFSKLNAGTRKHAVDRARLLGLLAA